MSTDETIPLSRREASRRAKIATLTALEETAASYMEQATWCEGVDHENCVTQALANNALAESLAKKWSLKRIDRIPE
jgi:hypothetical protein